MCNFTTSGFRYRTIGILYTCIYSIINQIITVIVVLAFHNSVQFKYVTLYIFMNCLLTPLCIAIGTVETIDLLSMKEHFAPSILIFFALLFLMVSFFLYSSIIDESLEQMEGKIGSQSITKTILDNL
jgi:hypothetical protein